MTMNQNQYLQQTDNFQPLSIEELKNTLGLTIKQDETNKLVTFLCELSAYTENAQFNISYNAPSSAGKSYIPTEIAKLFPIEDVIEIGYCSPTAFFHDVGKFDKERGKYTVDLSRRILIFLDQPHTLLLQHLRPLLSHDKKEINLKITDKTQKFGLKTKNVSLVGYPSVIFCTAGLRVDEQETTRFLLLSPEINQEKIRSGILEVIKKEADSHDYELDLETNPERMALRDRIYAIKEAGITDINIPNTDAITNRFLEENKLLKPRHQRDIKRLIAIIKSLALLNLWWRDRDGSTIFVADEDIAEAFILWKEISLSQELNLPPYIYQLYKEIILPAWHEKNKDIPDRNLKIGLSRQEINEKNFSVYGMVLNTFALRQQILPALEAAGLIVQEQDLTDKRKILVNPTIFYLKDEEGKNNSELNGGVEIEDPENDSEDVRQP